MIGPRYVNFKCYLNNRQGNLSVKQDLEGLREVSNSLLMRWSCSWVDSEVPTSLLSLVEEAWLLEKTPQEK